MFLCDYHTHSRFSFDGAADGSVDALCRAAIARGVTDLAITDHFECNWRELADVSPYDAKGAYAAVMEAKEKYRGQLHLTYGIELGQANQYPEEARKLLDAHPFEFVIGSIHNLRGEKDFFYFDFAELLREHPTSYLGDLFERNLAELGEVIDTVPEITTVAHLTYMQRYCAKSGVTYDFSKHADSIERLYKKMIAKGIALEVNLSTLWKGFGFATPDRDLLSLYRACGGRLVTVGSDAHAPAHIGDCVEEGFALLKRAGLDEVLVLREGQRTRLRI